ncbi:MAG: ABC transporter substrate-binding protein [Alphaproteobacteria bacterium]|nr:ABC transporter substrate-binding protein [Alphaproteobacteria bacterium]
MKAFIAACVLALSLFVSPAFAQEKPVVKIGASVPLTGSNAHIGEGIKNALDLALASLPADTKYTYKIMMEDDGLEAKKAASAANKLISVDKADAVISVSSGTGNVVSPIAEQNKIVHFGIASAASVAEGTYNFNHWTAPEEEARAMAAELQKRGFKKVAALFMNQQGVLAIRDSFKTHLEGTGIELTTDEVINPGEKDFRSAIAKAKSTNPDIYLVIFFTPELEILVKQIREAGITTPVTSIEAFSLSNEPALYEGLWYVDSAEAKGSFYTDFEKKFGKAPAFGAPNAYDIVNLIVKGYETAPAPPGVKPSMENVVSALHQVKDFNGVLGPLSIDDKGMVFSAAAVKIIKDGKPVLAGTVEKASPSAH